VPRRPEAVEQPSRRPITADAATLLGAQKNTLVTHPPPHVLRGRRPSPSRRPASSYRHRCARSSTRYRVIS
jgi:hypothetical protein